MSELGATGISINVQGAVLPFHCVGSNHATAVAAKEIIGIAGYEGGTDEPVLINIAGVVTAVVSAAVTKGDELEVDASSSLVKKTAGIAVARAMQTATKAGERIDVLILGLK